jgi:hypothetical protein
MLVREGPPPKAKRAVLPIAEQTTVFRQFFPEIAATGVNRTLIQRLRPQKTVLFSQKGQILLIF